MKNGIIILNVIYFSILESKLHSITNLFRYDFGLFDTVLKNYLNMFTVVLQQLNKIKIF